MNEERTPEPTPDDVARLHARFAQLSAEIALPAAGLAIDEFEIQDEGEQRWLAGLMAAVFADGFAHGAIELVAQQIEQGLDARLQFYDADAQPIGGDAALDGDAQESNGDESAGA